MPDESSRLFDLLPGALSADDIDAFKHACKTHLSKDGAIPSYALIDSLDLPALHKVQRIVEQHMGKTVHYLNDFYIYTDKTFAAGWHTDTELFVFDRAVNVWILLSPDQITDPLCFLDVIDDKPSRYYHSVKFEGDDCTFSNYSSREQISCSLATIEQSPVHTPAIALGDMLVFDPGFFHRTNNAEAKHCFVIKFVYDDGNGLLAPNYVPSVLWPEVGIFRKLLKQGGTWDSVLEGIRGELETEKGRKALSAGYFPENIELFRRMAETL